MSILQTNSRMLPFGDKTSGGHTPQRQDLHRQLEEFLEYRPGAEELLSRHILHTLHVAPCLLQKSEQVMWQSRMRVLQKKIQYRPERRELQEKGIVKDVSDAEFTHLVEGIESKLSQRPERVELVSKHILRNGEHRAVHPRIQSLQERILSARELKEPFGYQ